MASQNKDVDMENKKTDGDMKREDKFERGDRRPFRGGPRRGGFQKRGGHGGSGGHGRDNSFNKGRGNNDNSSKDISMQSEEGGLDETTTTTVEKKFTGRSRLFIGNITNETTEENMRELFKPFGELSEVYINTQRGFGFVRLDTRANAEAAKNSLDGKEKNGRFLRVRFASHGAALKVKHLPPFVSNELLEQAFAQFGTVERAIVIVDDRGKATCEGIVEFARKPGAQAALSKINNGVFLLGSSPRPVLVEPLEQKDEEDGLPEKFLSKNQQYLSEREQQPRFAKPGSFEFDYAQKWRELYRMEEEQKEQLQRQMEEAQQKLEMEMVGAQLEHQANLLRQDYLRKQEELKRMEEMHQARMAQRLEMRQRDDEIRRQNDDRRREMLARQQQEEELRRRQIEERRSDNFGPNNRQQRERNAPMQPPPAPPAGLGIDGPRGGRGMGSGGPDNMGNQNQGMGNMQMRQSRFDQPPQSGGMGGFNNNMGGGPGNGHMGNMGGGNMSGNMMNNQGMGNRGGPMGGDRGGMNMNRGMGNERMGNDRGLMDRQMERRDRGPDDRFFENKRPRRF